MFLEAEEKIEKIAAPSYLHFERMAEPVLETNSENSKPSFLQNDEPDLPSSKEEDDHFLDMQNSENATRIFPGDIEVR